MPFEENIDSNMKKMMKDRFGYEISTEIYNG